MRSNTWFEKAEKSNVNADDLCPHQSFPRLVLASQTPPETPAGFVVLSRLEALQFLHRGDKSVLTLHRKSKKRWENLGGLEASRLPELLPNLREHLALDAYFLINSTYTQRHVFEKSQLTGLPIYLRTEDRLQWLNALYVDLDLGHKDPCFRFEDSLCEFLLDVSKSSIPSPSLVVSSGRGLWAMWRITPQVGQISPIKAFSDKRAMFSRISRALASRFKHLGADTSSVDPVRVMRIPESLNTTAPEKTNKVVFFKGSEACTTLQEFSELLALDRKESVPVPLKSQKSEAKVRAGRRRWQRALEVFERLLSLRRCFFKGQRHSAIYVLALVLKGNRYSDDDILQRCSAVARRCDPPLAITDVRRCISASSKAARRGFSFSISNHKIEQMSHVTEQEKVKLSEWFDRSSPSRRPSMAARHLLIQQELRSRGALSSNIRKWIPTREMARLLFEQARSQSQPCYRRSRLSFNSCRRVCLSRELEH